MAKSKLLKNDLLQILCFYVFINFIYLIIVFLSFFAFYFVIFYLFNILYFVTFYFISYSFVYLIPLSFISIYITYFYSVSPFFSLCFFSFYFRYHAVGLILLYVAYVLMVQLLLQHGGEGTWVNIQGKIPKMMT